MSVSAWRCPRVWHARLSSRFPASNCHTGSDDRARLQAFARHLDLNSQAVRPPLTFDTSAELSACHASKLAAEPLVLRSLTERFSALIPDQRHRLISYDGSDRDRTGRGCQGSVFGGIGGEFIENQRECRHCPTSEVEIVADDTQTAVIVRAVIGSQDGVKKRVQSDRLVGIRDRIFGHRKLMRARQSAQSLLDNGC